MLRGIVTEFLLFDEIGFVLSTPSALENADYTWIIFRVNMLPKMAQASMGR